MWALRASFNSFAFLLIWKWEHKALSQKVVSPAQILWRIIIHWKSIFMFFTWQHVPLFTPKLKESPLSTYLAMGPCETSFLMSMGHGHTLIQMCWRWGPWKALVKNYTPTQRQIHTEAICGKLGTDTMI